MGIKKRLIFCFCGLLVLPSAAFSGDDSLSFFSNPETKNITEAPTLARKSLTAGRQLLLPNPSGGFFRATITRSYISSLGNHVISGHIQDDRLFVIAIDSDDNLEGYLNGGYESFQITGSLSKLRLRKEDQNLDGAFLNDVDQPVGEDRTFSVYEADENRKTQSNFSKDDMEAREEGEISFPVYSASPVIDILFFYDENLSNPSLAIDQSIEYSNALYANTEMNIQLNLVGAIAIEIDEAMDNGDVLKAMRDAEAPFTQMESVRTEYQADLIHTLRINKADRDEDNCGVANLSVRPGPGYNGQGYRGAAYAVTEWDRCTRKTVGHEIGHNLGALHNREDYEELYAGAYAYSYGTVREGVFSTLMGKGKSGEERLDTFSDPSSSCFGVPCGVPPLDSNAADNRRGLMNASRLVASFEGAGFDDASIQFWPNDTDACGGSRGHSVRNSSQYDVSIRRRVYLREDGTTFTERVYDSGDWVVKSGGEKGVSYCEGYLDDIRESFFVYENPVTGDLVEGTHTIYDDEYGGDYATVRAAAGDNGTVVGNPSVHARVDAEVEITFEPDYGYVLAAVTGTCPGSLHYNVYTAEPIYGDCWAIARFEEQYSSKKAMERVKSLFDSVMSVRGK